MRALICTYGDGYTWCDYFFPDRSICSLPVVGKALIEHILNVCMFFKMRRVKILDYCYDQALHANLGENIDSIRLTYSGADLKSDFAGMLAKNRSFMLKEKTMIFWGQSCLTSAVMSSFYPTWSRLRQPGQCQTVFTFMNMGS